jgi:hypothetical protein
MVQANLVLLSILVLTAMPVQAAESSGVSLLVQRAALGVMLVGGLVFFAWVAWLAFRR